MSGYSFWGGGSERIMGSPSAGGFSSFLGFFGGGAVPTKMIVMRRRVLRLSGTELAAGRGFECSGE